MGHDGHSRLWPDDRQERARLRLVNVCQGDESRERGSASRRRCDLAIKQLLGASGIERTSFADITEPVRMDVHQGRRQANKDGAEV